MVWQVYRCFAWTALTPTPNGLTLTGANRTRDRSTYDDEAAVGVRCSVELGASVRFTRFPTRAKHLGARRHECR